MRTNIPKRTTPLKRKTKPPALSIHYEIEEAIPPNDTRDHTIQWAPVCINHGHGLKVYQEEDKKAALATFKKVREGTRFRLVLVERTVIAEKE